ncbi:MAG: toxin TcdB middle/N-terminal domain-containing protein [bacterium]
MLNTNLLRRFAGLVLVLLTAFSMAWAPFTGSLFVSYVYAQDESDDTADAVVGTLSSDFIPDTDTSIFSGAARIKVPIKVVPGRMNMSPKLALTCNSYQGSKWIGVGFNLDMGFIQRSTKWGVNYNANGSKDFVVSVNGSYMELVIRSDWGQYTPNGSNWFGARTEGFLTKYYFDKTNKCWTATAKDGTQYFYGSTAASRQDFNSGSNVFKWCLDKVVDRFGNYMTISYTKNNGEIYPKEIDYTGNSQLGLSPTNKITFTLTTRTDIPQNFTPNYLVKTANRLSTISVYGNNGTTPIRKYVLAYQYSPGSSRSQLISVTEYGSDGKSTLPPIKFTWNSTGTLGTYALKSQEVADHWQSDTIWLPGDASGDGSTDLMGLYDEEGYVVFLTRMTKSDGTYYPLKVQLVAFPWQSDTRWFIGDVNADGKKDFMGVYNADGIAVFVTGISNGDGTYVVPKGSVGWTWQSDTKWFVGDADGDGKADFMGVFNYNNTVWYLTALSNGDGTYTRKSAASQDTWQSDTVWLVGDFNGDGKTDFLGICRVTSDSIANYDHIAYMTMLSNGDGTYTRKWTETTDTWNANMIWLVGDFNGDGRADIVGISNTSGNVSIMTRLSNGNGTYTLVNQQTTLNFLGDTRWFVGDVNGDSKMDLMAVYHTTSNSVANYDHVTYVALTSNGDGTYNLSSQETTDHWATDTFWTVGDANYDVKSDFMGVYAPDVFNNDLMTYSTRTSSAPVDLITKTTNGMGGTTTITYSPSSQYVNTRLPYILQVVSSLAKNDGIQTYTTSYSYGQGLFDFTEREFRGFGYVQAQQVNSAQSSGYESKTETWFNQDFTTKGTIQAQLTTSYEGHTQQVNNVWNTVNVQDSSGNNVSAPDITNLLVTYPQLAMATETVSDVASGGPYGFTFRKLYTYDPTYLAVTTEDKYQVFLDSNGNETARQDEVVTVTNYYNDLTNWILSKPNDVMVTDGSGKIAGRKWMDYDSSTGQLVTAEACQSDNPAQNCQSRNALQNAVNTYQYYTEGNLNSVTNPNGNTTAYTYDATKTYPYQTTNPLSHVTTATYNPATGLLTSLVPPFLQGSSSSLTYTYDVFGRLSNESRPDGGTTTYAYNNFGNPTQQNISRTEHIVGGLPAPPDKTISAYVNGFSRIYKTVSPGPNNTSIETDINFDTMGRVASRSKPYYSGIDTPVYKQFVYDGLSRVTQVTFPDTGHKNYTYEGPCKEVTDQNGNPTMYCHDVYKRPTSITDANDTVLAYVYNTLGNPTQTTAAQGQPQQNTTSMTYDSLSRKRSMTDPDMGAWSYTYDNAGNLICQSDAKGQAIGLVYDKINRVTEKDYYGAGVDCTNFTTATPTYKVTNTYDVPPGGSSPITCTASNGSLVPNCSLGMLVDTLDPSNNENKESTVLALDVMQRVTKGQKSVGSTPAVTANTYDSLGRTASISFFPDDADPSPRKKSYAYGYDIAGNTLGIYDSSGADVVAYSGFTALDQPGYATYPKADGSYVQTSYAYDPNMKRLQTLITVPYPDQNQTTVCTAPPVTASGSFTWAEYGLKKIAASGNVLTFTNFGGGTGKITLSSNASASGSVTTTVQPGIQKIVGSGNTLTCYMTPDVNSGHEALSHAASCLV